MFITMLADMLLLLQDLIRKLGYFFYIVWPSEHMFERVSDVPDYAAEVVPCFFILVISEQFVRLWKGKPLPPLNESIASISLGMGMQILRIGCRFAELYIYCWVFENYRFWDLPWDSYWTWWFGFLASDLIYYIQHRISHEVNIFWAVHQIHHSSQEFNMISGFRLSFLMPLIDVVLVWPAAFFLPPAIFVAHWQINLLYQFWMHTEVIKSLGPLEYIMNTPSHHRVHHGQNRYCIDKNYAGVLIIWDRIFGTFQAEKDGPIVYGMIHPIKSFEPYTVQFHHLIHIWSSFWKMKGWRNKLSLLFKGPAWMPGKPRLGRLEDIPIYPYRYKKHHVEMPLWSKVYVMLHFSLVLLAHQEVDWAYSHIPTATSVVLILFLMLSLGSIGVILDKRKWAPHLELARCIIYFFVDTAVLPSLNRIHENPLFVGYVISVLRFVYMVSFLLWSFMLLDNYKQTEKRLVLRVRE